MKPIYITLLASKILLLISIICLLDNCTTTRDTLTSLENQTSKYNVTIENAETVALTYINNQQVSLKNARQSGAKASIKHTIYDKRGGALFHVFNLDQGGFIIIAGDMRSLPVLAYSETANSLDIENAEQQNGLALWWKSAKDQMKLISESSQPMDSILIKEWGKYLGDQPAFKNGARSGNYNCLEWYTIGQYMCQYRNYFSHNSQNPTVPGPLLSYPGYSSGVFWGQNRIANFYAPNAGPVTCSNYGDFCGRFPAGCGATAMAQVLWHFKPNNWYNYWAMPQSSYNSSTCSYSSTGDLALAALVRACGNSASSNYGFVGTCNTLTIPSFISGGLQQLGLSNGGSISLFSPSTIMNETYQGYPVILTGTNSEPYIEGFDQHIWICDGFNQHLYSQYNCDTRMCEEWSSIYLYMNWGWNGTGNGWYLSGNFSPTVSNTGNYNSNVKMISGIRN